MERAIKRKQNGSAETSKLNKKPKTTIEQLLQLSDLNYDCLIEIFKYLSAKDLVNIVDYNNHFQTAALFIFKTKFRNQLITVTNEFNPNDETEPWSLKLLTIFGEEIKKLRMVYHDDYHRFNLTIENAIISMCHKSLLEIEFMNPDRPTMFGIEEPFEKIQSVSFNGGSVCGILSDFGKWFPNAHTLKLLRQNDLKYDDKIDLKHYPALRHLEVQKRTENYDISDSVSSMIVKLNPQLKGLCHDIHISFYDYDSYDTYDDGFDGVHLEDILFDLKIPNLESLHLVLGDEARINGSDSSRGLRFKKLKELTIEFDDSKQLKDVCIASYKLETLNLSGSYLQHNCLKFINENKNLTSIKIVGEWMLSDPIAKLINSFASLPKLKEVQFPCNSYSEFHAQRILDILTLCKLLNKMIIISNEKKCRLIKTTFDTAPAKTQWNVILEEWLNKSKYSQTHRLIFNKIQPQQ